MANGDVTIDMEVESIPDEEFLNNWAAKNKISSDVVDKLRQEGFTSMDALILIDRDDLCKAKLAIPRGQQKLVLVAVQKFVQSEGLAQTAVAQASQEMAGETSQTTDQSNGTDATGQISPNNGVGATIQTSAQVPTAQASGGKKQISTSGCQISEDPYLKALFNSFGLDRDRPMERTWLLFQTIVTR